MTKLMEDRLEELETKVTFQEDLLLRLDDMLVVHQKDISSLTKQLQLVTEQLQQVIGMLPEEPEPPVPRRRRLQ